MDLRMKVSSAQMDRVSELMGAAARDPRAIRQRVEIAEQLLEGLFVLPGTKRRVVGRSLRSSSLRGGSSRCECIQSQ